MQKHSYKRPLSFQILRPKKEANKLMDIIWEKSEMQKTVRWRAWARASELRLKDSLSRVVRMQRESANERRFEGKGGTRVFSLMRSGRQPGPESGCFPVRLPRGF